MKYCLPLILFTGLLLGIDIDIRPGTGNVRVLRAERNYPRDEADTLFYNAGYGGQFIMYPGDAMMIVYQMPADGIIKGVNVPVYEWGTGNQELTVSLHAVSYPFREDSTLYPSDIVDGAGWIGGYDMDDSTGWMSMTGSNYTSGGTVGVCDSSDTVAYGAQDPLGWDSLALGPPTVPSMGLLWPTGTVAATLNPVDNPAQQDNWINTADYGTEPYVSCGQWIGILVQFTGSGGGDDEPTGFYYADGAGIADHWVFTKFYAQCGGTSGNGGWHIRHWVIDFELAVLFTGDRPPYWDNICQLPTTISTDDRTACIHLYDDNPSGGPAGVSSVTFHYALDSLTATWDTLSMTLTEGTPEDGTWECIVPGQPPGTEVYWYITFADTNGTLCYSGNTTTPINHYAIFQPTEPNLFLYNATDFGPWITDYYLAGTNLQADYWGSTDYEPPSSELLDNYDLIIEVTGSSPYRINDAAMAEYLATGKGDYILTGDEYLCPGFPCDYGPSGFKSIWLGVDSIYNDINYAQPGDQGRISRLLPVESDPVSGTLYDYLGDSLVLNYDPYGQLGLYNWLDGVKPEAFASVAYFGVTGVISDTTGLFGADTLATGIYLNHGSGSQVVFLTFDPLGTVIDPAPWIGLQVPTVLQGAIDWVVNQVGTGDDDTPDLPQTFSLSQNYPNPFNTNTRFKISIPREEQVRLAIYDLLGREVAVLVDEMLTPGVKELTWDASQIASGIYFYRLETEEMIITRKMAVVK